MSFVLDRPRGTIFMLYFLDRPKWFSSEVSLNLNYWGAKIPVSGIFLDRPSRIHCREFSWIVRSEFKSWKWAWNQLISLLNLNCTNHGQKHLSREFVRTVRAEFILGGSSEVKVKILNWPTSIEIKRKVAMNGLQKHVHAHRWFSRIVRATFFSRVFFVRSEIEKLAEVLKRGGSIAFVHLGSLLGSTSDFELNDWSHHHCLEIRAQHEVSLHESRFCQTYLTRSSVIGARTTERLYSTADYTESSQ